MTAETTRSPAAEEPHRHLASPSPISMAPNTTTPAEAKAAAKKRGVTIPDDGEAQENSANRNGNATPSPSSSSSAAGNTNNSHIAPQKQNGVSATSQRHKQDLVKDVLEVDGDDYLNDDVEIEENVLPTPPDGGWGWVVVFASFIIHIIADGVAYSFGVFLVEFTHYFPDSGRGELGWIGSLMVGVTLGSGPIASALTNKYGCRIVTIAGAIIASFGFIISIGANSIIYLYFSFGITAGFGLGLIYLPAIVSVTYYFEKQRAFATGLAVCGSGIGTFIFAPLSQMLLQEYGWRGATLIEAGLLLNCVVCGALFRPLETKRKRRRPLAEQAVNDNITITVGEHTPVTPEKGGGDKPPLPFNAALLTEQTNGGLKVSSSSHELTYRDPAAASPINGPIKPFTSDIWLHKIDDDTQHKKRANSPGPMARMDIFYSGSLHNIPMYRSNPEMYTASITNLASSRAGSKQDVSLDHDEGSSCCSCCSCSGETGDQLRQMMDFSLLKDPLFMMFAISNLFTSIGFNVPYIYLPDRAVLLGIDGAKASFLISIIGMANTIGRVVFGWLSDRKFVNRLYLYCTALTLCGICTALSSFCVTYGWLVAYSASYGLFIGVYVSLTSVVLVDLLGLERLTSSFGLLLLFQGISTIVGPPIAGSVYDATQSYEASFYITGTMIGLSGAMLYFIPCVRRCVEGEQGVSEHELEMGKIGSNTHVNIKEASI